LFGTLSQSDRGFEGIRKNCQVREVGTLKHFFHQLMLDVESSPISPGQLFGSADPRKLQISINWLLGSLNYFARILREFESVMQRLHDLRGIAGNSQ
jgi:hypothetical protein